ncbi:MAG: hypothetical protein AAF394_19285 [Planctomycetota bacterium]
MKTAKPMKNGEKSPKLPKAKVNNVGSQGKMSRPKQTRNTH